MPLTKEVARQYPLVAVIELTFADLAAGANLAAQLPPGAIVVGGEITVNTVFDSTTNTLSIGDAGSATRYASAVNLKSAARTALTLTGYKVTDANKDLLFTYAETGAAATAGAATVVLNYVVAGRAHEVFG
jgi:hypothetical protein